MKGLALPSIVIFSWLFLLPHVSPGQQADAPVYKDGDWWRVKVKGKYGKGLSRSGRCDEVYSEYLVKIDRGNPKVYGLKGNSPEEIDCPVIATQLLGIKSEGDEGSVEYLKFPLSVGESWASRISEMRRGKKRAKTLWIDLSHKVTAWERFLTPKGELEAFKIEISGWPKREVHPYYYSPKAKAIVHFQWKEQNTTRTDTVVDFNVSP